MKSMLFKGADPEEAVKIASSALGIAPPIKELKAKYMLEVIKKELFIQPSNKENQEKLNFYKFLERLVYPEEPGKDVSKKPKTKQKGGLFEQTINSEEFRGHIAYHDESISENDKMYKLIKYYIFELIKDVLSCKYLKLPKPKVLLMNKIKDKLKEGKDKLKEAKNKAKEKAKEKAKKKAKKTLTDTSKKIKDDKTVS